MTSYGYEDDFDIVDGGSLWNQYESHAMRRGSQQPAIHMSQRMTTKVAPSYSGRASFSAYVDEIGGWRDILDCIIRHVHSADPAPVPSAPIDDEIPWVDCPTPTKPIELLPPMQADKCVLVFSDVLFPSHAVPRLMTCSWRMRSLSAVSKLRGLPVEMVVLSHCPMSWTLVVLPLFMSAQRVVLSSRELLSRIRMTRDVAPLPSDTMQVKARLNIHPSSCSALDGGECG